MDPGDSGTRLSLMDLELLQMMKAVYEQLIIKQVLNYVYNCFACLVTVSVVGSLNYHVGHF